jgi:hypothetical protein
MIATGMLATVRTERLAVCALAAALCTAACSAQPAEPNRPANTPSAQPSRTPKPPARIGATLDLARIGDGRIAVTLVRVIDPATVSSFVAEPGKAYAATLLTIANTGGSTIVGDANNDVSVLGSDEQTYRAALAGVAECQNFTYGGFLLAPGQSATGCVSFALPPGVTPVKVTYSPSSGLSHDVGEWLTAP